MKIFQGKVFSDKMKGVAVVVVQRIYTHQKYGKILKKRKKIHAENKIGAKQGQRVEITEQRPLAKTVSFRITKVLDKEGSVKHKTPCEIVPELPDKEKHPKRSKE